ncbi:MAG: DUF3558 domain-containing protein [Actinophytocola sp.]|uniref:DUF3558 domain-containing protein n=1 Tax=Actinophytocola sp. TaxID=1872138 RepID=UPI003C71A866
MLTGCAVRSNIGPAATDTRKPDPSAADTSEPLLPPRSRELDLSGVDPCTDLLTDKQLRGLDYDLGYARPPMPGRSLVHGGPTCTFSSSELAGGQGTDRNMLTLVGISTTASASSAAAGTENPDVVTIHGFSALVLTNPMLHYACLVVVDTADGQYLDVSSSPVKPAGTEKAEPYCHEARVVARMALETIAS